jgi:hypothetical protein
LIACFQKAAKPHEYTTVSSDSIKLNGIFLENSDAIKSGLFSEQIQKKIYTPPTGDSDEYDRIHYWEDDNIKIKFYEKNSIIRVSSIVIKTKNVTITIGTTKIEVGQRQVVLESFKTSYNTLTKMQLSQPPLASGFYLNVARKKSQEYGLMTCFLSENQIAEVVFSFDPA